MDRRSLFYWSREFASGINRGEDYIELANVIVINIVDYGVVALDEFHTSFHLWEDTRKDYMLTNAIEIHFIDIRKFRRLNQNDMKNALQPVTESSN